MSTAIATWGNSEAVRLPKSKLKLVGLESGDLVDVEINERGHLEIVPQTPLRMGRRRNKVTFDELFKGYIGSSDNDSRAWPDDAFEGAEKDAWL
jgi:antitoxin component of MazEF toxin-antitoxin module